MQHRHVFSHAHNTASLHRSAMQQTEKGEGCRGWSHHAKAGYVLIFERVDNVDGLKQGITFFVAQGLVHLPLHKHTLVTPSQKPYASCNAVQRLRTPTPHVRLYNQIRR